MKFVGIDFGHGEVSASYYDGVRLERLRLVRTTSTNEEEYKIPSYLYKCLKKDGTIWYDIQEHNPCTLLSEMKKPIEAMTDAEKTCYREFVKLVYARLLELNNELLAGTDFSLAIACPTKWNAAQKMEYKSFVEQALGRDLYAIMNESDAAYFAKRDDTNTPTLVVDYGSSTIDFTCVANGGKVNNLDQESSLLGASHIESILLNIYKNDAKAQPSYREVEDRVNPVLAACHREWIKHDGFLKADLREMKENMFSSGKENLKGKVYLSAYEHPGRDELKGIYYEYAFDGKLMEIDRIKQYVANVKNDFVRIKGKLNGYNITVQKIILSGGASCMPWVKDALKDVFKLTDQQIALDNHPSFVVSDGIVKYCYERHKCLDEFLDDVIMIDVEKIYKSSDEQAINTLRLPLLRTTINEYASPNNKRTTLNDLVDMILNDCFLVFDSNNVEYAVKLNDTIKENAAKQIFGCLDSIIYRKFNVHINADEYNKKVKDFPVGSFPALYYNEVVVDYMRKQIHNVVDGWYSFSTDWFFVPYNDFTYQRDLSKRKEIAAKMNNNERIERLLNIEKATTLDKELIKAIKADFLKWINSLANYLFDEMELFRTRFASMKEPA